ncbi:MAG: hypothetical protein WCV63_04565 [Negativicutes bacterium]|jgi:hypothetical protein
MKILFIPEIYYLSYESFLSVIRATRADGFDSYLLLKYPFHKAWEENEYSEQRLEVDNCPYKKIVLQDNCEHKNIYFKIINLLIILFNSFKIYRMFLREKPDAIVINSDLGGIYIRIAQELCLVLKIKIFIIHNIRNVETKTRKRKGWNKWFRFLFCDDYTIGAYTGSSIIFSASNSMRDEIVLQGIDASRIFVVGDPRTKALSLNRDNRKKNIDSTIILYCTEVIQESYGNIYTKMLNCWLLKCFTEIATIHKIKVIVKLHPREKEHLSIYSYYYDLFGNNSELFDIVGDHFDNVGIISRSDIVLGHYTDMLFQAAVLKKPIIAMNYLASRTHLIFSESIDNANEIVSHNSLETKNKIIRLIVERKYREKMVAIAIRLSSEKNGDHSNNDEEVATMIARLIRKELSKK